MNKKMLLKLIKKISIFLCAIIISQTIFLFQLKSQCPCEMGAAVSGGITPGAASGNIGVVRKGSIRSVSFFSNSNGNEYLKDDVPTGSGFVKSFNTSYLGLMTGYGLNEDLTIDLELGYFINKNQDLGSYNLSGHGFSHLGLYAKYNISESVYYEREWTLGAGFKVPLTAQTKGAAAYVEPSTGAITSAFMSFFHKGYKNDGIHFVLANRAEYSTSNSESYQNGFELISSIYIIKSILNNFFGTLELKHDLRLRDRYDSKFIDNSGWNILSAALHLNYNFNNFNISVFYENPLYKYYNGNQLTTSKTFGASLMWQTKLVSYY